MSYKAVAKQLPRVIIGTPVTLQLITTVQEITAAGQKIVPCIPFNETTKFKFSFQISCLEKNKHINLFVKEALIKLQINQGSYFT